MPSLHVLTVQPHLSPRVLDAVLSAVEHALVEVGATHTWIAHDRPGLAVMADLPADDGAG